MTIAVETAVAPTRTVRVPGKKAAPAKAVAKKTAPAAASAPAPAKKATTELPKGISVYGGRYYSNIYTGAFDTIEECVAIRQKFLDFKAALKDEAQAAAVVPAPAAAPAKRKASKKKVAAA